MGWRPHEVRAASLSDFTAALEGWQEARGGRSGPDLSDEAMQELGDLMARYPDKVTHG